MARLPVQFYKDMSGGMVTNVNKNLMPKNAVALLLNCEADEEIGSAVTRLGTGIVGSQLVASMRILGLTDFRDADGSNHALLATVNAAGGATSVVYKVGTGTIRTGLTASKKMRFVNFLDSVLMVNGADAEASYDGSSVITTGGAFDLANIPGSNTCSLALEWLDRVYVAGDTSNPDRLYYSSTPTSGAVSWTSGNGYVDIEPEDGGGGIKGLGKVPGYLLIFKERALKRWSFDSAFPETLIQIGTPSHESIINAGGLCAFFSASSERARGFYITNGDRPIPISHDRLRNIKKWIDAIPQANEANVAGWGDGRCFWWSIGDVTVDGRTFNNVVVRWNRILDQWSVRTYPQEFTVFSSYVSSGTNTVVAGDDNGQVIQIDKASTYTDYNAQPINWEVQFEEEDFGYNQVKEIADEIIVNSSNMDNARVVITHDGVQDDAGTIMKKVSQVKLPQPIRANTFQIAVAGTVSGARGTLKEVEIPNVTVTPAYVS
jgi:hypothetical protein